MSDDAPGGLEDRNVALHLDLDDDWLDHLVSLRVLKATGSFWKGRLGRILRFVAIVWALAASYKLLEQSGTMLMRSSVSSGLVDSEWVVPEAFDPDACAAAVAGLTPRVLNEGDRDQIRRQVFRLGVGVGRERAWKVEQTWGAEPRRLPRPGSRPKLAEELGVPVPEAPDALAPANIFEEFSQYLINDPQCIAARLVARFSPLHASLYRFAAVVGQEVAYRQLGLVAPASWAELRYYGSKAEVPEELWSELASSSELDDLDETAHAARSALERLEGWVDGR